MKTGICDEIFIAEVCRKMGWTYQQYLAQPDWFIDTLVTMWEIEGKVSAKHNDKE